MLLSWSLCNNKVPQTWWLKTTETYSLTVLGARQLKSRCGQVLVPSGISGGELIRSSLLAPGGHLKSWAFLGLQTHHSNLWTCISESVFPSLATGIRDDPHLKILTLITSAKTLIPTSL